MSGTWRVRIAATVLLGLAGGCLPAVAQPPPGRAVGWVLRRTGPGPARLEGEFVARAASSTAMVVTFALTTRGARQLDTRYATSMAQWGFDGWTRVYDPGGPLVDCPASAACADATGDLNEHVEELVAWEHRPLDSAVYVVAWDVADPVIRLASPGWRAIPWTPAVHVVTTDQGGGTGVRVGHYSAGSFVSATAPGGRHGSLAWGALPCSDRGEGSATFGHPKRERTLSCGGNFVSMEETSRAVEWRLRGQVRGSGGFPNALFVVHYPPR